LSCPAGRPGSLVAEDRSAEGRPRPDGTGPSCLCARLGPRLVAIGAERFVAVSSGRSFAQGAGAILRKQAPGQNPDKDELRAVRRRRWLFGVGGITGHRQPSRALGLVGSAGAVAAGGTVGLPVLATALAVPWCGGGAFGAADDRPGPGGWLAGVALAAQLDHHVVAQGGVLLVAADLLIQLGRRPLAGGEGARVERHKHRIQGRCGWLAAALAGGGDGAAGPQGPQPAGAAVASHRVV
jgi:hypothetical protein